jgi:opacity protein-like surface antigen
MLFAVKAFAWEVNPLIGASVDYARYDGRYDIGLFYTGIPLLPLTSYQDRQSNTGFGGGMFAGYQLTCNQWILGLELSADWYDTNKERVFTFTDIASLAPWDANLQFRNKGFYALSARAGYEMAPFFLSYVRLGVETTHQEIIARFQGAPSVYPFGVTLKDDSWQNHIFVGVGAEFPLPVFCQLNLRLEYNYHFPSHALRGRGRIIQGGLNPIFSIEGKPSIDTGKVALVWNF